MKKQLLTGMALAAAAAVLWTLTLATSLILPAGFPTGETIWGRYGAQLLILLTMVMPFRGTALVRTSQPRLQILRGSMMVVMPVAFTVAVHRIGPSEAWAAVWIAPLVGMALGQWMFGESIARPIWLLAVLATIGAIVAHGPSAMPSLTGLVAAAGAGVSFGAFLTLTRTLKGDGRSTGLFWTAACVFVPVSLVVASSWQPLTPRAVLGLASMGGLWLLVLLAIDEALRRAPLAFVAPFLLTEIVWTRLLFHVPWTRGALAGSAAVMVAAAGCAFLAIGMRESRVPAADVVTA